jgi:hypothetical protein
MATARFAPCPHCGVALSYLQGVSGSTMGPKCPTCRESVEVPRPTFLMLDHSSPGLGKRGAKPLPRDSGA